MDLHPRGHTIATAASDGLWIWKLETCELVRCLRAPGATPLSVALHPSHPLVAARSGVTFAGRWIASGRPRKRRSPVLP